MQLDFLAFKTYVIPRVKCRRVSFSTRLLPGRTALFAKVQRTRLIILGMLFFLLGISSLSAQDIQYVVSPDNNYSRISSYSNGLAKVEIGYDSTGFLNTSGKLLFTLPYDYSYTGNFHGGRAYFEKKIGDDYKYGFINKRGEMVIPPIYDKVKNFSDHRAAVKKDGKWQFINLQGDVVISNSFLITKTNYANTSRQEDREPPSFHSGLLRVKKKGKYGYVDTTGKVAIPFKYESAENFKDGIAVVSPTVPESGNYNWKLINTAGDVVYDFKDNQFPQFDTYFSSGGKIIFMEETRGELMMNHKYGVVNDEGEIIVQPTYSRKPFPYSDGVAVFQVNGERSDNKDGYMLIIDSTGTVLGKTTFQTKYGVMYDSNHTFQEGLLAVEIATNGNGRKWGYINKKCKFVIKPQFNTALNFHYGRAVVVTAEGQVAIIKNPLKE